eukprot:Pgem_evm1s3232
MKIFNVAVAFIAVESSYGALIRRGSESNECFTGDIMFLFDKSTSIARNNGGQTLLREGQINFGEMKTFARQVIDSFTIDKDNMYVGFTEFRHLTYFKTGFETAAAYDRSAIINELDSLQYTQGDTIGQPGGTTKTGKAILDIYQKQFANGSNRVRPDAPKIIALVTDGASIYRGADKYERRAGEAELQAISGPGNYFTVDSFSGLNEKVESFIKSICSVPTPCVAENDVCEPCSAVCDPAQGNYTARSTQTCAQKIKTNATHGGAACDLTDKEIDCDKECKVFPTHNTTSIPISTPTSTPTPPATITSTPSSSTPVQTTGPAPVVSKNDGGDTNVVAIAAGSAGAALAVVGAAALAGYYKYANNPSVEAESNADYVMPSNDASPLFESGTQTHTSPIHFDHVSNSATHISPIHVKVQINKVFLHRYPIQKSLAS